MQIADCLVRIGGDVGNTVPRYGVTAAELALLREIHGEDAVVEITPIGEVEDYNPVEERSRLSSVYGAAKSCHDKEQFAFAVLYPGANPRLFDKISDIGIPEACFAASGRVKPDEKAPAKAPRGKAPSVLD